MKTILSLLLIITFSNVLIAQTTAIPDANFEQALINLGLDISLDGQVLTTNINVVETLWVNFKNIGDLTGIEDFIALKYLDCSNNQLTTLNFSQNTALRTLKCSYNPLTSIDITQNTLLNDLNCSNTSLSTIDLTQNTLLEYLYLANAQFTGLNVSQNTSLLNFYCNSNQITSIDVTHNLELLIFVVSSNSLTEVDVSQNTQLTQLSCDYNNQLTSLNVTQNTALTTLHLNFDPISSIDLSQNVLLEALGCNNTLLSSLNLSYNTSLYILGCNDNPQLSCLNIKNGNNSNVTMFFANNNPNLSCIEVDNVAYSTANWNIVDAGVSFSTNCPNPCSVGIEENSLSNLSFYPNPTMGDINIDLGEFKEDLKATLTNGLGQVILTQYYTSTNFINLDIDAPNGIYYLKIETSNGELITKKIIKE